MAQPLSGYTPASDTTLAFFRKDVERGDRQLESIMVSRVVMGEILTRLDQAEIDLEAVRDHRSLEFSYNTKVTTEADAALAKLAAVQKRALQSEWIVCGELLRILADTAAVPTDPTGECPKCARRRSGTPCTDHA